MSARPPRAKRRKHSRVRTHPLRSKPLRPHHGTRSNQQSHDFVIAVSHNLGRWIEPTVESPSQRSAAPSFIFNIDRRPSFQQQLYRLTMSAKRRHVVFKKRLAAKMLEATRMGHTIAKQAGAINGESGLKLSAGCFDDVRPIDVAQAVNARAGLHGSTL